MTIHRCKRCNYLYIDEDEPICFEDLDKDFRCPRCRCGKSMFVKKELPK